MLRAVASDSFLAVLAVRCVQALQKRGCEFIISLTHMSLFQDKQLAEACDGIDVIMGGHDHDPYYLIHRGVLIVKCGQNAAPLLGSAAMISSGSLQVASASCRTCFACTCIAKDHVGILDVYLKRAVTGGLEVKHSFHFWSTSDVQEDPLVAKAVARWKTSSTDEED